MSESEFAKYDTDPMALEWARSHVQTLADRFRKLSAQAQASGNPDRAAQWRKFANLLEMELVGGDGCTIRPFDWRRPDFVKALQSAAPEHVNPEEGQ